MKLKIKNVGILSKVDLEINGITVIAGENDTGKSTVSKSLYAMFLIETKKNSRLKAIKRKL